jgi:hypothetical protein
MRILIAATMKGAVNYHRLLSPHIMLKSAYPETEILTTVNQKSILNTDLSKVDIIVFTRIIYLRSWKINRLVKKKATLQISFRY